MTFFGTILATWVVFGGLIVERLVEMGNGIFARSPLLEGIFVGVLIGMGFSFTLFKCAHYLVDLITGYRAERLLIRYHDALAEAGYELVPPQGEEPADGPAPAQSDRVFE